MDRTIGSLVTAKRVNSFLTIWFPLKRNALLHHCPRHNNASTGKIETAYDISISVQIQSGQEISSRMKLEMMIYWTKAIFTGGREVATANLYYLTHQTFLIIQKNVPNLSTIVDNSGKTLNIQLKSRHLYLHNIRILSHPINQRSISVRWRNLIFL